MYISTFTSFPIIIKLIMNRLRRLRERDEAHRERQRIINQHEAFVYDSQSRLEEEEFIEFSSEEEREVGRMS